MPTAVPSAHESTDPRPGLPGVLEPREAGADAAAEASAPIVLVADAGSDPAGTVTNGNEVMAAQRAKLRACYAKAPTTDRRSKGKLVVHLDIDGTGAVREATATKNEGYGNALVTCLADTLKAAKFTIKGARAVLDLPVGARDIAK